MMRTWFTNSTATLATFLCCASGMTAQTSEAIALKAASPEVFQAVSQIYRARTIARPHCKHNSLASRRLPHLYAREACLHRHTAQQGSCLLSHSQNWVGAIPGCDFDRRYWRIKSAVVRGG